MQSGKPLANFPNAKSFCQFLEHREPLQRANALSRCHRVTRRAGARRLDGGPLAGYGEMNVRYSSRITRGNYNPLSPWQGLSLPSSRERPRAVTRPTVRTRESFAAPARGGWMAGPVACHGEMNVRQSHFHHGRACPCHPAASVRRAVTRLRPCAQSHSPRRRAAAGWQARWPAMVK